MRTSNRILTAWRTPIAEVRRIQNPPTISQLWPKVARVILKDLRRLVKFTPLLLLLVSCEVPRPTPTPIIARVTFYHPHEDKWGSRIATGGRAREGWTMAAPRVVPFSTKVVAPLLNGVVGTGHFNVEDRGGALERYYRKGQLRLDVYVDSRRRCKWLGSHLPEFMPVILEKL